MRSAAPAAARVVKATLAREFLSYRINRFLHLHVGLMLAIGALALLAPPQAAAANAGDGGRVGFVPRYAKLRGLSGARDANAPRP